MHYISSWRIRRLMQPMAVVHSMPHGSNQHWKQGQSHSHSHMVVVLTEQQGAACGSALAAAALIVAVNAAATVEVPPAVVEVRNLQLLAHDLPGNGASWSSPLLVVVGATAACTGASSSQGP